MVKRLIFDVDNTLINWNDEYWDILKKLFNEFGVNYDKELANNLIDAVNSYEEYYEYFTREQMLEHINKTVNYKFNMNFLNTLLKEFEKCVPDNNANVYNTLEYLSKKYELVILTNWFKDVQVSRLKNFGILNFFSKVFAGETFKIKPNKESFVMAMENRTKEECIMVGDNFRVDIQGALDIGLKAIYINPKLPKETREDYVIINKIEELQELL